MERTTVEIMCGKRKAVLPFFIQPDRSIEQFFLVNTNEMLFSLELLMVNTQLWIDGWMDTED